MIDGPAYARRIALVAIPALVVLLWAAILGAKGPYWLGLNLDPDYAYLLNALNVATGAPPGHTDHPGTALQLLGAAVLSAAHAVSGEGELAADVVARPERYLAIIQWVLFAAYAASLVLLGWSVRAVTGSLSAAVVAQLTPVLSGTLPAHVACVKPEPLLLALSACAGAIVVWAARKERAPRPVAVATALGAIFGAALATKLTAAPLVALAIVFLGEWTALGVFALATTAAAAALTSPAWTVLGRFVSFAGGIATHSGRYGGGEPSLLDPTAYAAAVVQLLWTEPVFVASMVACALAIARRGDHAAPRRVRRALIAMLATQVASVLFVARHPSNHYLAPALGLTGVVLGLLWTVLAPWLRESSRTARAAVAAVVIALCGNEAAAIARGHRELELAREAQLQAAAEVSRRYPDATVVRYYRSSDPAYALHFGNGYTELRYAAHIAARHPGAVFYDIWSRRFERYDSPSDGDAGGASKVVLHGSRLLPERMPAGLAPSPAWSNDREMLYELRRASPAKGGPAP